MHSSSGAPSGAGNEERLAHVNRVLRSLRELSRLAEEEDGREGLLQRACECLTATGGYAAAWGALLNGAGGAVAVGDAGLGAEAEAFRRRLRAGELPHCAEEALARGAVTVIEDPAAHCPRCPVGNAGAEVGGVSAPLRCGEGCRGVLHLALPRCFLGDEEALSLVAEAADTLGTALRDLSTRRQLERTRRIVERSPVVLLRWRATEGWPVEYVSENITRFGYQPADLLSGRVDYASVIHPEDRDRVAREVAEATGAGEETFRQEYRLLDPDGGVHWVDDRTRIERDAGGAVVAYEGIVLDITERREVEEKLSFRAMILEQIRDGVVVTDLDGVILYVNEAECRMLNRPREELVGASIRIFGEEPVRGASQEEILRRTLEEGAWRGEVVNHAADGGRVVLDARTQLVRDDRGNPVALCGIASEITAYKEMEEALREREARLHSIFRAAPAGIGVVSERRLVEINERVCEMVGRPREDLEGQSARILYPSEEDYAFVGREKYRQIREHGTGTVETRWQRSDGEIRHVILSSTPIDPADPKRGVTFTAVDITERRRAEEALRASEEYFRRFFRNATAGIAVYEPVAEGRDFVFVDLNPAGERYSHIRREEVLGRRLTEVFPGVEELGLLDCLRRVLETGEPEHLPLAEYRDQRLREWVENRVFRLSPRRVVAMYEDKTEQRHLEERLRQTEKMDAIGQLAGGVAHDFNNQLAGIMGYAEILEMRLGDAPQRAYAEKILLSAQRAADLTDQLLAFARKGRYQSEAVDLHAVIREVVAILGHSIDRRIEIVQRLEAPAPFTVGDPSQLQNLFLNLALNARDAMPRGGELIFQTGETELDPDYCDSLPYEITPGRYVEVSVTDSGCGMERETVEHIFEPFFTTKPRGEGTGMGLAAVYGTVKQHRGAVRVYSEVGSGSTFRVYLPLTAAPEEAAATDGEVVPAPHTAKVLVVDDEGVFRDLARDLLTELGYEVETEEDGAAGVTYIEKHPREVDLVLLDLVMPKMGGRDAFEAIRRLDPALPVVIASGYSVNGEAQALLDAGAAGFLQKPFRQGELSRRVAQALGQA